MHRTEQEPRVAAEAGRVRAVRIRAAFRARIRDRFRMEPPLGSEREAGRRDFGGTLPIQVHSGDIAEPVNGVLWECRERRHSVCRQLPSSLDASGRTLLVEGPWKGDPDAQDGEE